MELLTAETDSTGGVLNSDGFLSTFISIEPSAEWLMSWLHDHQIRTLATPRLAELLVDVLEKTGQIVCLFCLLVFKFKKCLALLFDTLP